ncbi:putative tail tubular protein [uncultured Mediterranean phage uvMED]|nr:putative tail tubular protein [uncultured Mediterranean phage uvMED]BAQ85808.1 putative tail tubular protein [uncultured Mediterranean phage uvMED]BAQ85852.1 putative tail tubular protein [uncultured Mediterranean phage uvMED]
MTSAVDIANSALNNIGASTINSLTEDSVAARIVNQRYVFVRDAVFRSHPWNCLVRRASLAQNSTAPTWGYTYAYNLPTDPYCLRVLRLEKLDLDYKVEGRTIVSDEQTMKIKFIARVTDPNEYDTLLVESIAARLAADICYGITNSNALVANMVALYESKLKEARFVDATEGMPGVEGADLGVVQADTFINSRY